MCAIGALRPQTIRNVSRGLSPLNLRIIRGRSVNLRQEPGPPILCLRFTRSVTQPPRSVRWRGGHSAIRHSSIICDDPWLMQTAQSAMKRKCVSASDYPQAPLLMDRNRSNRLRLILLQHPKRGRPDDSSDEHLSARESAREIIARRIFSICFAFFSFSLRLSISRCPPRGS